MKGKKAEATLQITSRGASLETGNIPSCSSNEYTSDSEILASASFTDGGIIDADD